jgi:hypothetical protein
MVEEVYRKISQDLARFQGFEATEVTRETPTFNHVWVYLESEFLNKVYVMESSALGHSLLGRFVDADRVRRVHTHDREALGTSGLHEADQTVWAEVTEAGRAHLRGVLRAHQEAGKP